MNITDYFSILGEPGGHGLKSQTVCVLKYIWIKSGALLLVLKNHDFSTPVLKVFRQKSGRGLL